ncbi:MAG: hypothetical protein Q9227_008222 [Pyrenula ochraceoflavens]
MATPRVLLLGGHGKVSLQLTPLLLAKSWDVISVIRNPDQRDDINATGHGKSGKLDTLVSSLEDVKSDSDAKSVLDSIKPNIVVWSAGAGGKGGSERTYAIDQDAAKHYIAASLAIPTITKFLMVSYVGSRRSRAPWWTDEDWTRAQHVNNDVLPHYYKAKVEADEYLTAMARRRRENGDHRFQSIVLRPGSLTDTPATGKVNMGKTPSSGSISRADVAAVAAALLERDDTRGWFDLLGGEEPIPSAIEKVVESGIDCLEGEDVDRIYGKPV